MSTRDHVRTPKLMEISVDPAREPNFSEEDLANSFAVKSNCHNKEWGVSKSRECSATATLEVTQSVSMSSEYGDFF